MVIALYIFYILLSIILLWKGSEWLVESAVRIANRLSISQLVIGLTVVAFGTSAPEFAVTIGAAVQGQADISVSNIIGSNIFNLGFILGGVAVIQAIQSSKKLIWRDGAILIAATITLLVFIWDLKFGRIEGIILFIGLIGYNFFLILQRKEPELELRLRKSKLFTDTLIFLSGTGLVILGGYILRLGAVGIARAVGITEWVIGATVIAAGTSAPEFATSLMASLKGHHGISSGNLVGSCIYNVMGVLGLAGILRPLEVSPDARSSIPMLILLVILAIVFLGTHKRLSRIEGIILIAVSLLIWIVEFI